VRPEPSPGDYIPATDPASLGDHEESSSVRQIYRFDIVEFDVVVTLVQTELSLLAGTKYGEFVIYYAVAHNVR
jgi:hypothetical protein